jgi:hypothetical protein
MYKENPPEYIPVDLRKIIIHQKNENKNAGFWLLRPKRGSDTGN